MMKLKEDKSFWFKGCRIQKTYPLYKDNGIETVMNDNPNYFIGEWFKVVSGEGTKRYRHTHFRYDELGNIEGYLVYPVKHAGEVIGYEYHKLAYPFLYFSPLVVETLYNNSVIEHQPPYGNGYLLLTDEGILIEKSYSDIFKHHQKYEDNFKKYNEAIKLSNEILDSWTEAGNAESDEDICVKLLACEEDITHYRNTWMKNIEDKNKAIERTKELIKKFKKEELLKKMHLV